VGRARAPLTNGVRYRRLTWDSRRDLAIKGKDEIFRRDMVAAYAPMSRQMPDNGIQVVMFTHQDAAVWADLGSILWAAGLRVTAAWNVVTETESTLKAGNYVQGTICLVLRKRLNQANATFTPGGSSVMAHDPRSEPQQARSHQ
jgi:putative DNA methylase